MKNVMNVNVRRVVGSIVERDDFGEIVKNVYKGSRGGLFYYGTKYRPYAKVYLSQLGSNSAKHPYIDAGSKFDELERFEYDRY